MSTNRSGLAKFSFATEIAIAGLLLLAPLPIPAVIVLVVLASIALEVRGLGWSGVGLRGDTALRDSLAGTGGGLLVAILLALAAGRGSSSEFLLLEGNVRALLAALLVALAMGAASEMLFRGYVIAVAERAWGGGGAGMGLAAGAILSSLASLPLEPGQVVGVLVMSLGYGLLYFASGRRLLLPIAAHFVIDAYPIVSEFLGG